MIAGKVVAITGAARGIGRATAAAFARAGARVCVGDLDAELAGATAAALDAPAVGAELDVADSGSFMAFIELAERELGPLEVLVNNAGVMLTGPFAEESDAVLDRMLAVNLRGVLVGSRLAAQRMLPRGRGTIVNVASQAGRFGFPGGVTYCASKWGVVGASEALAAELHGSGVRVRVVLPSAVSTDLIAGLGGGWREPAPATPEQAGAAVLRAATSRVFAHGVPRRTTAALNAVRLLPHGARAGLIRLGGAGEYLLHPTDATARGRYLDRAGAHR